MRNRTVGINIRVTSAEKEIITLNAMRCHLSNSDYLRKLGIGWSLYSFPQDEFYRLYKSLCYLESDFDMIPTPEIKSKLKEIKNMVLKIYLDKSVLGSQESGV